MDPRPFNLARALMCAAALVACVAIGAALTCGALYAVGWLARLPLWLTAPALCALVWFVIVPIAEGE